MIDTFLSIIIPVYGGEKSIAGLVDQLCETLEVTRLEIVLVNDCSPDNCHTVCGAIQAKYPEIITYVQLAKNKGEHNAVMAGLNYCQGDYAVIMDDDSQNPPSEVLKLLNKAIEGQYDVVYSYYEKKKHSTFRNLGSKFNGWVANSLLDKPKDLYLSSFKCINKFTIAQVIQYTGPYPYLDGLILRSTQNIGRMKVVHNEREEGESGYTLAKLVGLWMNMFINFSVKPLRIASILGTTCSVLGMIVALLLILQKIFRPDLPVGWTSLIVVVMIFSGAQLLTLGLIGEYIGRIFLSQNNTPQYTVRNVFSKKNTLDQE